MSAADRHDWTRVERDLHAALERTPPGPAGAAVLRRIGGRAPARIVEEGRIRSLRALAAAAALVLGVLFALGDPRLEQLRVLHDTSLSAVVAIDVLDVDELQNPAGLIGDLFAIEVPE